MKRICTAHRTDGQPCQASAIRGGTVCRSHGGSASQVREAARRRLLELVDPALVRLDRIIRESNDERIVLAALKEVLTRAGIDPPVEDLEREMDVRTAEMVLDREFIRLKAEYEELNSSLTSSSP